MRDMVDRALKQITKSYKTEILRVLDSIFTFGDTLSSITVTSHKLELKQTLTMEDTSYCNFWNTNNKINISKETLRSIY